MAIAHPPALGPQLLPTPTAQDQVASLGCPLRETESVLGRGKRAPPQPMSSLRRGHTRVNRSGHICSCELKSQNHRGL